MKLKSRCKYPRNRYHNGRLLLLCCLLCIAPAPIAESLSQANSNIANIAKYDSGGLATLIQGALTNNPALSAQRANLAAAREGDDIAGAELLPQFAIGARHAFKQGNNNNNEDNTRLYASVAYNIFNLPLNERHDAEKHRVVAAENRYRQAEQNLQLSVMETWLDYQLARSITALTQTRIDIANEQLAQAQAFAKSGIRTKVDVLDAEARLSALRADLLQQQYDENLWQERIINLTGFRGTPAALDESSINNFIPLQPLGAWLASVLEGSLNANAARADLEAARSLVRASDKVIFPRLVVSGESSTPGPLNQRKDNLFVSFEQPILSGGRILAEGRQIAATSQAARETLHSLIQQEELRVRELHGRIALAPSRWRALEAASEAADASLSAVRAGYQNGVRVATDVLDAEETLFEANLQLRRARFNYLKDLVSLHVLAGEADVEFIKRLDALFINDA